MDLKVQEPFENPDAGLFIGTIIDLDLAFKVPSTYMGEPRLNDKVILLWLLNDQFGKPAVDSKGKQFILRDGFNAAMFETSNLYKRIVQILGTVPPVLKKTEELESLLIGRSGQLFLVKAPNLKKPDSPYTNISGFAPLAPGQVAPVAPAGYVRIKNRPPKPGRNQAAPVAAQPTGQAPAPLTQAAPAFVAPVSPAVAPAPSTNVAF
jgi:hypothetical protein